MRSFYLFFLLLPFGARAQQNLFNIASGDITPKKDFFYQHQINLFTRNFESKSHFVYGLGRGWDVGVNVVNLDISFRPGWNFGYNSDPAQGALFPVVMPTLQKQFILGDRVSVNLGTQTGFNLSGAWANKRLSYFHYGLGVYYFKKRTSRVVVGPYYSTPFFLGEGNRAGVLAGYEVKIFKRWYLMGDFISGRHSSAVSVIGGMYNAGRHTQLCAGLLIPNPSNPKPMGIVLELNLFTWELDLGTKKEDGSTPE